MDKRTENQMKNVKNRYPHPSVTNDVVTTEYEAYPDHLEKVSDGNDALTDVEKSVVEHTTDGKTWNSINNE